MKRRKEYMPRTGIRMDRKPYPGAPGGFISADIEILDITGSVERSLIELDGIYRVASGIGEVVLTGSTDIRDSVASFGTAFETGLANANLLGLLPTGLGYHSNAVTSARTGSVPSWTNRHLGHNAAFVIPTLSASNHESQVLNFRHSGTESLELSASPASSSLYYSKRSAYNRIVAKKTASFFDTVPRPVPVGNGTNEFVPTTYTAGLGSKLNLSTGSEGGAGLSSETTPNYAAHIFIDVPVKGKLVDIAVWIELHHVSSALPPMPLGSLAIALKAPHFAPGPGQPFLSDKEIGASGHTSNQMYSNSFILWEGVGSVAIDQRPYVTDGTYSPDSMYREKFPCWDRDLSMRTVFHDGAPIHNPRHNLGMHGSGNYAGSPNSALGINNAWGMAVDWTGSAGSPPSGWLTGPGGVANVNEWPTTGSNRGATHMKPVYPMLDAIEMTVAPAGLGVTYPASYFGRPVDVENIVGRRAGLRGTEISGTWKILFSYATGDDSAGIMDLYFRQARLEITYENNESSTFERASAPISAYREGRKLLWEVSGAGPDGLGPSVVTASNYIYAVTPPEAEIGRSFGIQLNTGSINPSGQALLYRITGTLADISGSAPGWLLNNQFGMPSIPQASASLVEPSKDSTEFHPQDVLTIRPLLDGARRIADAARDAKKPRTRANNMAVLLSGSLT